MTDEEKYAPELFTVDRETTERAIAAWNFEARRRAREDIYVKLTGRRFLGLRRDPNAAFIVGVMQKYFVRLAKDKAASIRLFPFYREDAPIVMGVISVDEAKLETPAREALLILRHICDDVSQREEEGEDGRTLLRIRFTLHDVWCSYEYRGNAYDEWLWLTYG